MDSPSRGRAGRESETWHKISVCVVEDGESSFGKRKEAASQLRRERGQNCRYPTVRKVQYEVSRPSRSVDLPMLGYIDD